MRAHLFVFAVALAPLSVLACSSSSSNGAITEPATGGSGGSAGESATGGTSAGGESAGTGGISAGGAASFAMPSAGCLAAATVTCALLDQCRANDATNVYGSQAECVARTAGGCALAELAPGTGQNDTVRQACATAQTGESCPSYVANLLTPVAACAAPPGAGAVGAACAYSAQCASAYCDVNANTLCGTCSAPPTAGSDCSQEKSCGQNGLRCVTDATTMAATCQLPLSDGTSCLESSQCGEQSYCAGVNVKKMVMGKCTAFIETMGTACDVTMDLACDVTFAGLTCDATTKTCQPIARAAVGSVCGNDTTTHVYTGCTTGSACVNGTCQAFAAEGAACDSANGPSCLSPATCIIPASGAAGAGGASTVGVCALHDSSACH